MQIEGQSKAAKELIALSELINQVKAVVVSRLSSARRRRDAYNVILVWAHGVMGHTEYCMDVLLFHLDMLEMRLHCNRKCSLRQTDRPISISALENKLVLCAQQRTEQWTYLVCKMRQLSWLLAHFSDKQRCTIASHTVTKALFVKASMAEHII